MANFRYSDDGNHHMWIPAHQGGSYSRVSRVQRFFVGSDDVFAAIGGDSFRQDSHVAFNQAFDLGRQVRAIDDIGSASISTIGIVEDEFAGYGRYFFLRNGASGGLISPEAVAVYDSDYTDEMTAAAVADSWLPLVTLPPFVEQGMRIVNLGLDGAGDGLNRTFLFYLSVLANRKTRVNVVRLPDPGDPPHSDAPLAVVDLDFEVADRFYAVHHIEDQVFLYFGDTDRSRQHRTFMVGYDPVANTIFRKQVLLINDQKPFPRSYAAGVGNAAFGETPVHMVLEPRTSWLQGAGSQIDDDPNVEDTIAPLYRRSTGSSWALMTVNADGKTVEDSVTFTGEDLRPWMGAAHADSQGGAERVAVVPRMLQRIAPPPAAYAALGSTPQVDSSSSYALQAQVVVRQEGVLEDASFVYRRDSTTPALLPTFGNNRATSNIFGESPPAAPQGSQTRRVFTPLLVPGTVLIENQRILHDSSFAALRTVKPTANRLREWELDDDSVFHGHPATLLTGSAVSGIGVTDHDQSTDCLHGVQGDIFDPDLTVVVGWFRNGTVT